MPPIVVLGASGFVGRSLVRRLAADDHAVTAVTRSVAAFADGVTSVMAGTLGPHSGWTRTLTGAAAAIHLASAASARGAHDADGWIAAEAETARHVAQEIARARVPQAILLSSILVHGEKTGAMPFQAQLPLAPATLYARGKVRIEQEMTEVLAGSRTRLAILRPPPIYGPEVGHGFRTLMQWVRHAPVLPFRSIRNRRSLLYRENLVDLVSHILRRPNPVRGVYLVRDDEELSTPELVRRLGSELRHRPVLVPCPVALLHGIGGMLRRSEMVERLTRSLQVDDHAMRTELGWSPPHGTDMGLAATCRWFLEQERDRP